jgi:hypothetical protein
MYCAKCGNEIVDGQQFCANCGTPIATSAMQMQHNSGHAPIFEPSQNAAQFSPPQKRKSKTKKVIKGIVIAVVSIFIFLLIIGMIFSDETNLSGDVSDELKKRIIAAIEESDPDTDFDDENGTIIYELQSINIIDDENSPIDILEVLIEESMNKAFTDDDIHFTTLIYVGVNIEEDTVLSVGDPLVVESSIGGEMDSKGRIEHVFNQVKGDALASE